MPESEIDPAEPTSPGTVDDPAIERERAEQAAKREAESRASDKTKLEEERDAERADRAVHARRLDS